MPQEFATAEEALAHHGVKGQKWGVRRDKPTNHDIYSARAKIESKTRRLNSQIDKTNLASDANRSKEAKKLNELSKDFLLDPDRATAARMTTGEKVISGILIVGVPGVGTAAGVGYAGTRVAIRKSIEREQRKAAAK